MLMLLQSSELDLLEPSGEQLAAAPAGALSQGGSATTALARPAAHSAGLGGSSGVQAASTKGSNVESDLTLNPTCVAPADSLRTRVCKIDRYGCMVVRARSACGRVCVAASAMKYSEKLVIFVAESERKQLTAELAATCSPNRSTD
eukprot:2147553-Pleurochrysis_carterae.AAC.1